MCSYQYGTSSLAVTVTISPNRTLKFFLTTFYFNNEEIFLFVGLPNLLNLIRTIKFTLFMRMLQSSVSSFASTMQTVSFPFFPFRRTLSPRNNCSSSIFAGDKQITELSSLTASSTTNLFGAFFLSIMAVFISSNFGMIVIVLYKAKDFQAVNLPSK